MDLLKSQSHTVDKPSPCRVNVRQMTEKNKQTFFKLLQDHNWDNILFNSAFSNFFNHIERFPNQGVRIRITLGGSGSMIFVRGGSGSMFLTEADPDPDPG